MPLGQVHDEIAEQAERQLNERLDWIEAVRESPAHVRSVERCYLATMMARPAFADSGRTRITPDEVQDEAHRSILRALVTLRKRGEDTSPLSVVDQLMRMGLEVDDEHNLRGLVEGMAVEATTLQSSFDFAAKRIADAAERRLSMRAAGRLFEHLRLGRGMTRELVRECQAALQRAISSRKEGDDVDLKRALDDLETKLPIFGGRPDVVPTGFKDFDKYLTGGGAACGEVVLIAARPSMGKTALVTDMIRSICIHRRVPVGVFSLEMDPRRAFVSRMLIGEANVAAGSLQIREEDWKERSAYEATMRRLYDGQRRLQDSPLHIDGTDAKHIDDMKAIAVDWHREDKIGAVFIDFLQLADGDGDNRAGEVDSILEGPALDRAQAAHPGLRRRCAEPRCRGAHRQAPVDV